MIHINVKGVMHIVNWFYLYSYILFYFILLPWFIPRNGYCITYYLPKWHAVCTQENIKKREILGLETYGNVNPSLSYVENKTNTLVFEKFIITYMCKSDICEWTTKHKKTDSEELKITIRDWWRLIINKRWV